MISLGTFKTVLFTVGPFLLPRLIGWYRKQRVKTATAPVAKQPVPKPVYRSFNILFISALIALASTAPYFDPENIFTITSSRLQTPNDVLFTRLSLTRGGLTDNDHTLKPKLASLDSRLLYLTYGPDVLTHCPFCLSDDPLTYFYFALPSLMIPHLLHLLALGMATSNVVVGSHANRWRTLAATVGMCLALCEFTLYTSYDYKVNARKVRPEDYVLFAWNMRMFRGIVIAVADAFFAGLLWLSSTNRMFVIPPTSAERTEMAMRLLESSRGKLNAVGVMRNVVSRDENLRKKSDMYWRREGQVMGEVMDEREVVEGVRNALSGRIQMATVEADARKYAEGMTAWQDGWRAQTQNDVST